MQFKEAWVVFSDTALKLSCSQIIKKLSHSYYGHNPQPLGNPDNQKWTTIVETGKQFPQWLDCSASSRDWGQDWGERRNYTSLPCESRQGLWLLNSAGTRRPWCFQEFHPLQNFVFTSSKSKDKFRNSRDKAVGCSRRCKLPPGQNLAGNHPVFVLWKRIIPNSIVLLFSWGK